MTGKRSRKGEREDGKVSDMLCEQINAHLHTAFKLHKNLHKIRRETIQ